MSADVDREKLLEHIAAARALLAGLEAAAGAAPEPQDLVLESPPLRREGRMQGKRVLGWYDSGPGRWPVAHGTRRRVYAAFVAHVNEHAECWPSLARVSRLSGVHVATVKRHVKALQRDGLMVNRANSAGGQRRGRGITAARYLPDVARVLLQLRNVEKRQAEASGGVTLTRDELVGAAEDWLAEYEGNVDRALVGIGDRIQRARKPAAVATLEAIRATIRELATSGRQARP